MKISFQPRLKGLLDLHLKNEHNYVDLWIIDKFNILPTDERFLSLYEEQKEALFYGVCNIAKDETIRRHIQVETAIEVLRRRPLESFGSKAMLMNMKKVYRERGMDEEQIKIEIDNHLTQIRDMEIAQAEKRKNG